MELRDGPRREPAKMRSRCFPFFLNVIRAEPSDCLTHPREESTDDTYDFEDFSMTISISCGARGSILRLTLWYHRATLPVNAQKFEFFPRAPVMFRTVEFIFILCRIIK
jgi:hypothetical protein